MSCLPISDKDIEKHLFEYGDQFIIDYSNFAELTQNALIKVHKIVNDMLVTKAKYDNVYIAINKNQHLFYELMKYMYDHKELN